MHKYTDAQKAYFSKLKLGQKITGKVKRFTNYGAFISLGMVDGLLASKDITWGRINDPEDFLKLYQKLEVIIIFKDEVKFNIAVGLKQLLPNPWEIAKTKYKEGDTVVGQVVDIQPYGAFLQVFPGFEGLVHISEIYTDKKIDNAKDFFEPEQAYEATIIKLDFENRKMGLSIK
ncbi:MAG TPA: S1 RNA-binding domain-containing protein [Bacteroidia bacterium]|nr:S1 RNA-binding domain-containing protein [Bacteroidia bacterium]